MVNIDGLPWKRSKFNIFEKTFLKINTIIGMSLADTIIIDSKSLIHHIPQPFLKYTVYSIWCLSIPIRTLGYRGS